MTRALVHERVPIPDATGDVLAGKGVKAQTMRDLAVLTNSLAGRGMQLIPMFYPNGDTGVASGFNVLAKMTFWLRPRYQAVERIWYIVADVGGAVARFRVGGVNHDFDAGYQRVNLAIREELSSQSSTGAAVDFYWGAAGSGTGPSLISLACVELPRRTITDGASDRGTVATRFNAGQAIQREDFDNLFAALDGSDFEIGRRSLMQWATYNRINSTTTSNVTTTSASYQDLWDDSIPALTRKRLRSDTQNQITVKVLAWMGAGTGSVRVVTDSGNTSSAASVTDTSPAWHTLTVDVDCTDTDSADGRQTSGSPGWDGLQLEYKSDGTNTIYVASVSAYEES